MDRRLVSTVVMYVQAKEGAEAGAADAAQPSFMYEVAWQASAAVAATATAAAVTGIISQRRHTAQLVSAGDVSNRSLIRYGAAVGGSSSASSMGKPLQGGDVTWVAAGSGKQQGVSDPAAVIQGLELLQRLLANSAQAASSVALSTAGALPAATSSSDIAGAAAGSSMKAAAAPVWGLARVAALEYADCRWQAVDRSQYAARLTEVKGCGIARLLVTRLLIMANSTFA